MGGRIFINTVAESVMLVDRQLLNFNVLYFQLPVSTFRATRNNWTATTLTQLEKLIRIINQLGILNKIENVKVLCNRISIKTVRILKGEILNLNRPRRHANPKTKESPILYSKLKDKFTEISQATKWNVKSKKYERFILVRQTGRYWHGKGIF